MTSTSLLANALGRTIASIGVALDTIAARCGIAPPRLELTAEIKDDIYRLFGDSVDPAAVIIRVGHVPGVRHARAFALPALIYLGAGSGLVQRAAAHREAARPRLSPLLVHELVHAWQATSMGPRYIVHALWEQLRYGRRAYDWTWWLDPCGGNRHHFAELPVEAQAQFLMHAYAAAKLPGIASGLSTVLNTRRDTKRAPVRSPGSPYDFNSGRNAAVLEEAIAALGIRSRIGADGSSISS